LAQAISAAASLHGRVKPLGSRPLHPCRDQETSCLSRCWACAAWPLSQKSRALSRVVAPRRQLGAACCSELRRRRRRTCLQRRRKRRICRKRKSSVCRLRTMKRGVKKRMSRKWRQKTIRTRRETESLMVRRRNRNQRIRHCIVFAGKVSLSQITSFGAA